MDKDEVQSSGLFPSASCLFPSTSGQKNENEANFDKKGEHRMPQFSFKAVQHDDVSVGHQRRFEASHVEAESAADAVIRLESEDSSDSIKQLNRKRSKNDKKEKKKKRDDHEKARDLKLKHIAKIYKKAVFLEDTQLKPEEAFRIDRKHDLNNLAFNEMYFKHVSSYRKMKSDDSSDRAQRTKRAKRYFLKTFRKKLAEKSDALKCKIRPIAWSDRDFIKLTESDAQIHPKSDDFYSSVFDAGTFAYSKGESKPESAFTSTSKEKSSDNLFDKIKYYDQQLAFEKSQKYNQELAKNPTNVTKWIEFVNLQPSLTSAIQTSESSNDKSDLTEITGNKKRHDLFVTEKQLAILDKALKHNPGNHLLLMQRLRVQQNVLDPKQLDEEWKNLVFRYPNQLPLWFHYFEFVIGNVTFFTVLKLTQKFCRCITKMYQIYLGQINGHERPDQIGEYMLKMTYSYALVLAQSGNSEMAIAMWQALIEFNFFLPDHLRTTKAEFTDCVEHFDPFWESGAPRIGESNALGWKFVMKNQKLDTNQATFKETEKQLAESEQKLFNTFGPGQSFITKWIQLEATRQSFCWIPVKSGLADQCDDSERIISFQKIEPILFRLDDVKELGQLIRYCIHFLDPVLLKEHAAPSTTIDAEESPFTTDELKNVGHLQHFDFQVDKFRFVRNLMEKLIECSWEAQQSALASELTLIWFEFLLKTKLELNVKEVKKLLKKHLKLGPNRQNLHLWHLFCRFEQKHGDPMSSLKAMHTALGFSVEQGLADNLLHLTRFSKMALQLDEIERFDWNKRSQPISIEVCRMLLLLFVSASSQQLLRESNQINSIALIKTTQQLKTLELSLWNKCEQSSDVIDYKKCAQLLFIKSVIAVIMSYYPTLIENVAAKSMLGDPFQTDRLLEILRLVDSGRLSAEEKNCFTRKLYRNMLRIALLRFQCHLNGIQEMKRTLDSALHRFPNDPTFLRMFVHLELGSALSFRVRRYISESIRSTDRIGTWRFSFAIWYELKRLQRLDQGQRYWSEVNDLSTKCSGNHVYSGGVAERVRALFEQALRVNSCVFLWRLYIAFEVTQNELQRARVIVYRALQQCPWSKNLYLDSISLLDRLAPTQLDSADGSQAFENLDKSIVEIVQLMKHKGVRVRTLIEELKMLLEYRHDLVHEEHQDKEDT